MPETMSNGEVQEALNIFDRWIKGSARMRAVVTRNDELLLENKDLEDKNATLSKRINEKTKEKENLEASFQGMPGKVQKLKDDAQKEGNSLNSEIEKLKDFIRSLRNQITDEQNSLANFKTNAEDERQAVIKRLEDAKQKSRDVAKQMEF